MRFSPTSVDLNIGSRSRSFAWSSLSRIRTLTFEAKPGTSSPATCGRVAPCPPKTQ